MSEVAAPDVVVIGGGPGGSTAATILARKGRKVLLLERRRFPRYHIGESMIPFCYFPLERLGLVEAMKSSTHVKKYSVQFVSADGRASIPFYFFQHFEHEAASTWQVVRSDFDHMLLENAREYGVEVLEETTVHDLLEDGHGAVAGVTATRKDGTRLEVRAPVTIDASGRRNLASLRYGWRVMDPELKKLAVWTYYRGATRDGGRDEGATTVAYVNGKNWFWYIPLRGDVVSVGIVGEESYLCREGRDAEAIFLREVRNNRWIEDHLAAGTRSEGYRITADYTYRARHCARDGLVLVGDAFAFLDPIFSSGLFLALHAGVMAGDAVHEALLAGDCRAERFLDYGERICAAIDAMRSLVIAFYDPDFSFRRMFDKHPELKGEVTDCLIGNLHRDFSRLFDIMRGFARVPEALEFGLPARRKP